MTVKMQDKAYKDAHGIVIMPKIFENIKCSFDKFEMEFSYSNNLFEVNITSDILTKSDIENIYWDFYSYLNIILGYFPKIEEISCMSKSEIENIADQFKTKNCYVRASEQYIKSINEEQFKNSFIEFRRIKEKIEFTLSMFNVSMMDSIHYPEMAVIFLLQSLDGLYDELFKSKANNKKIRKQKLEYIKNVLNSVDIENINENDYGYIKGYMEKISDINFIDKLRFFISTTKFDVFHYEKHLSDEENNSFEKLLNKFVNTRNKFSHSIKKKDVLSGKESAVYFFKLIILYRLLLFEKIGISDLINEDEFLKNLKDWDDYINEKLQIID